MKITPGLKSSLLHLSLGLLCISAHVVTASEKPNVIVIFTDDQRADTIAALGNPNIKTPNLDRLVGKGLVFKRAYMQGAFTGATCVPSRAMLLSGQSLFHVDTKLLRDETWPAAFGRSGYNTFMSGKWHNTTPSIAPSFQVARNVRISGYTKDSPLHVLLSNLKNGRMTKPKMSKHHAAQEYTNTVVKFLQNYNDKKPFFCYVPMDGPHDPHRVPKDFPVHYDPAKMPLPVNFMPQHPFDNGEMKIRDEVLLPHPRSPKDIRKMLCDYYRFVSYLDMQVGRILKALEDSPHAKNTIVVFASDSGVGRGSHGLIGKQNLYEYDSLRVPLIISGPGIPAGKTTDAMCYLYDLLPTLGARCGVAAPPKSEGMNLNAVLQNPSKTGRPNLVFAYRDVQRAIATKDWKLITYPKVKRTQLFHLSKDPHEMKDLSGDPEQKSRLAELKTLMIKNLKAADDKLIQPN